MKRQPPPSRRCEMSTTAVANDRDVIDVTPVKVSPTANCSSPPLDQTRTSSRGEMGEMGIGSERRLFYSETSGVVQRGVMKLTPPLHIHRLTHDRGEKCPTSRSYACLRSSQRKPQRLRSMSRVRGVCFFCRERTTRVAFFTTLSSCWHTACKSLMLGDICLPTRFFRATPTFRESSSQRISTSGPGLGMSVPSPQFGSAEPGIASEAFQLDRNLVHLPSPNAQRRLAAAAADWT